MIRFLVLYERPADVEAFERHYWDVHIPLAKKLPGLRRYAVGRNPTAIRGGDPSFLVAELEWDDMASLQRAFESPEGKATAADIANFAPEGVRSMVYELEDA